MQESYCIAAGRWLVKPCCTCSLFHPATSWASPTVHPPVKSSPPPCAPPPSMHFVPALHFLCWVCCCTDSCVYTIYYKYLKGALWPMCFPWYGPFLLELMAGNLHTDCIFGSLPSPQLWSTLYIKTVYLMLHKLTNCPCCVNKNVSCVLFYHTIG